jgi:hypothetical protein
MASSSDVVYCILICRDRMSEILSYLERNMQELDTLAADVADAVADAEG